MLVLKVSETQKKILKALTKGKLTRRQLMRETKLPRTTIYDNLVKLANVKHNGIPLIKYEDIKTTIGKGRPKRYFYIPRAILYFGIRPVVVSDNKEIELIKKNDFV